jgi:hypothetical protein
MSKKALRNAGRRRPGLHLPGAAIGNARQPESLGGAEFIGRFRFAALEAIVLKKAMSPVVVASALPCRTGSGRSARSATF